MGDHLFLASESVLADVGSRGGGVEERSMGRGCGAISVETSLGGVFSGEDLSNAL